MHQTTRLIDRICEACKRLWNLEQFITIDESIVRYKGKHCLAKQYMPKNPMKWGLKVWCAADISSKYIYDFDVYCRRNLQTPGDVGMVAGREIWSTK